jgi:Sec-independent protein translocase protein TatA
MFSSISLREILLFVLVLLLLFRGGQIIPNLVRGITKAIQEFKDSSKGDK